MNKDIDAWNKWDLHIHSPKSSKFKDDFCKKNCPVGILCKQNIDEWVKAIINKWEENNVKLASITDHNLIDKDVFEKLTKNLPETISLIPGIEVDAYITDKNGHISNTYVQLIIHIDPASLNRIVTNSENKWEKFFQNKSLKVTFEDVLLFFISEKVACNISVEGYKDRGIFFRIGEEELDIKKEVINLFNLGYLNSLNDSSFSNMKYSQQKWEKLLKDVDEELKKSDLKDISHFLASDNHCPQIYPAPHHGQKGEISFFNGRNNFLGLCLALNSKGYKIKSGGLTKVASEKHIKKIRIKRDEKDFYDLEVSKRLNVIIGPRSSGKTLFLKLISSYNNQPSLKLKSKDGYEKLLSEKNVSLSNFDDEKMLGNANNIKEFEQNYFIDPLLEDKKSISITDLLKLDYPEKSYTEIDSNLRKVHNFYRNYKNFLINFLEIINNPSNNFKNFDNLYGLEKNWYTEFYNNLKNVFDDKNELITNFNEIIGEIIKNIKTLQSTLKTYRKNIEDYESFVKKNKLNVIFSKKIKHLDEELDEESLVENSKTLQFYQKIIGQLKKRLSVFHLAKVDFELEKKAVLDPLEEQILERDENIGNMRNLFSSLVHNIENIKREEISVNKFYEEEAKYNVPKSKYEILPTRMYFLRKPEVKETLNRVISPFMKNLIDENRKSFKLKPQDYLSVEFIKKTFLENSSKKIDPENIFLDKNCETDYFKFREKVFEDEKIPVIMQNNKKIEDNSPGKIAQIYFDIEASYLLDTKSSIVLLDQPEDSIDNMYIAKKMVWKIRKILGAHKQVFLVTHNASLVINTYPDNVIIPFLDENKKIQYVNGRLEDEITINYENKGTVDWIGDYIEGGKKAFFNRLSTYEIGWKEYAK